MNRIDRLQAILIQLQSKKVVTAQEIATRFNISIRTVYRDIRSLEEAGVPIGAEAGVGYFLSENYTLPPVMFTTDEALAILFASKLAGKLSDNKVSNAVDSALFKIKAVLNSKDKENVEKLDEHIAVYHISHLSSQNLYLSEIQKSLLEKHTLIIDYKANNTENSVKREVEPIGLCYYGGNWHLIAYCRLRKDFRDFRTDRIQNLSTTLNRYETRKELNINNFFEQVFSEKGLTPIILNIKHDFANNIKESKYWYGFVSQDISDDFVTMKFVNNDLIGFAKWLLWAGKKVEIVQPPELKSLFKNLVIELNTLV